jgi:hypothetical protein
MALQMTLRNTPLGPGEIVNPQARGTDVRPVFEGHFGRSADDAPIDFCNLSVVNALPFRSNGKERSEALEYLCPKSLVRKFANSEITTWS